MVGRLRPGEQTIDPGVADSSCGATICNTQKKGLAAPCSVLLQCSINALDNPISSPDKAIHLLTKAAIRLLKLSDQLLQRFRDLHFSSCDGCTGLPVPTHHARQPAHFMGCCNNL